LHSKGRVVGDTAIARIWRPRHGRLGQPEIGLAGRIGAASDEASLEELRVAAVGKKGEISLKMRELGKMSPEERQVAGPALNALKDEVNAAITAKKARWPMPRSMSG
jgi:phenylalanyl-tRNA synthetase alpha subunit